MFQYFTIPLMSAIFGVVLNAYSPIALLIVLAAILTWFVLYQLWG